MNKQEAKRRYEKACRLIGYTIGQMNKAVRDELSNNGEYLQEDPNYMDRFTAQDFVECAEFIAKMPIAPFCTAGK
jgi:hypothetical protein